ncbi:MAG: hypothetical protein IPG88_25645 [Gemmatimonadetes bacterium]|nr:hypothetical protein [Gemmatimonadota bacterium]
MDAAEFAPTFGSRYFFGEVARRELALPTRINAAFSPTLSFQFFAQPLVSSGDYSNYKQLLSPSSFNFNRFREGTAVGSGEAVRCQGGATCVDANAVRYFDFDGNGTPEHTIDEQDFNVRSLIGNAVVRWEYRPGSTIFWSGSAGNGATWWPGFRHVARLAGIAQGADRQHVPREGQLLAPAVTGGDVPTSSTTSRDR